MSATREPTELEGCVLGVLSQMGPCTGYAIRKVFLTSPSPHWSGSAGAIYPLIERLEKLRLVRSANGATGRRRSKHYSLTPKGHATLCHWLGPPLDDSVLGLPPDPLRTRIRFMAALTPKRKKSLLIEVQRQLQAQVPRYEEECERFRRNGERHGYLMARGGIRLLRARLEWIREVIDELASS